MARASSGLRQLEVVDSTNAMIKMNRTYRRRISAMISVKDIESVGFNISGNCFCSESSIHSNPKVVDIEVAVPAESHG